VSIFRKLKLLFFFIFFSPQQKLSHGKKIVVAAA